MTEKHLSDDRLTQLFYEQETGVEREHLLQCASCARRYGDLTEALKALDALAIPERTTADKIGEFETAWQASGLEQKRRSPGFLKPLLRHAVSFSAGLACGMVLLAFTAARSGSDSVQPGLMPTVKPVPAMLTGTPAARVFSELENPVLVVLQQEIVREQETKTETDTKEQPSKDQDASNKKNEEKHIQEKRVIEGTAEHGNIQIVWNL